jgi:hypothetical protein
MKNLMTCLAVGALSGATFATTWTVDVNGKADFDRIQDAVDAASTGDEIIVMPGTYAEEGIWPEYGIIISNKDIYLHSSDGPATTIIDGENTRRCMMFYEGVTSATTVEGFTFQNGYGAGSIGMGGAMYVYLASPNITNCIFQNNYSPGLGDAGGGGAVSMRYCWEPTIFTNCAFKGNVSETVGGALSSRFFSSAASLLDCTFCENEPDTSIINGPWNDLGGNDFLESCPQPAQIQWRIEDGGNGHWYELVYVEPDFCWGEAKIEAELQGGYLATITSQGEQDFLEANVFDSSVWMWIGGYQDLSDPDYSEPGGGWKWVTGEPMDYTHWYSGSWGEMPWDEDPPTHHWMQVGMTWWNLMWKTSVECGSEPSSYVIEFTTLPGSASGACCLDGLCITTASADCEGHGGSWGGADSSCTDFDCPESCPSDVDGDGDVGISDILMLIAAWGACP